MSSENLSSESSERPSFIELVRSNHEFPGPYVFKVIGYPDDGFIARVVLAVREELNLTIDPPYSIRQSSAGKYVALTLEPYMMTAEEVLAVYAKFQGIAGIVTFC